LKSKLKKEALFLLDTGTRIEYKGSPLTRSRQGGRQTEGGPNSGKAFRHPLDAQHLHHVEQEEQIAAINALPGIPGVKKAE